jgi:hypothetical protein
MADPEPAKTDKAAFIAKADAMLTPQQNELST